jgi:hypothetical protein
MKKKGTDSVIDVTIASRKLFNRDTLRKIYFKHDSIAHNIDPHYKIRYREK